jgi:hypothetical protein
VLHATLTIPDVASFILDPDHRGRLDGAVSFDPIGRAAPADAGWFKLFARTADPEVKLMVYRLTVASGPKTYTLHGEKHVRRGSVLRGWPDTTTLRCRLHAGPDDLAPVCGAGILRIGIPGFVRQLASFRTVDAPGPRATVRALSGFLAFFARELAESYLPLAARAARS